MYIKGIKGSIIRIKHNHNLHQARSSCRSFKQHFTAQKSDQNQKAFQTIAVELSPDGKHNTFFYTSNIGLNNHNLLSSKQIHCENDNYKPISLYERATNFLKSCYLPEGYPHTVTKDYKTYYQWNVVQGICGSASYVLSTKALLTSVTTASTTISIPFLANNVIPVASAISWVLKDGLGCLGVVLLASKLGSKFDTDAKRHKWKADVLHNIGVGVELITPLFPGYFLWIAGLANVSKGLAGLTSGATKAAINKNFSLKDNLGDITAKSQTQGITLYLIGMSFGITLSLIPSNIPGSLSIFLTYSLLAATHLYASYRALSSVQFKTFNEQRFYLLMERYLKNGQVISPEHVRQIESIILPHVAGVSEHRGSWFSQLKKILKSLVAKKHSFIIFGSTITDAFSSSDQLQQLISLFMKEKYLLSVNNNRIHVVLNTGAASSDNLKAFFHAVRLQAILESQKDWTQVQELIRETLEWTNNHFDNFVKQLESSGWDYQTLHFSNTTHFTAKWYFVDNIAIS